MKTGYKLELLSPETMKLLGDSRKDVDQDKDGEDEPKLESVEVVLVHYNPVNNNFFNCYLAAPWPTLGHSQGDSLTDPMLIIAFCLFQPEGDWELCNGVWSLSLAERLTGFELGIFRF